MAGHSSLEHVCAKLQAKCRLDILAEFWNNNSDGDLWHVRELNALMKDLLEDGGFVVTDFHPLPAELGALRSIMVQRIFKRSLFSTNWNDVSKPTHRQDVPPIQNTAGYEPKVKLPSYVLDASC